MAARLNNFKALLEQLYIRDDFTAKEVAKYMKANHQVDLNEAAYQRAFRKWEIKKNRNHGDYCWVYKKKRGREAQGKRTRFIHNGQVMDDAKIRKEISRNVSTAQQITTVTTPGTPSGWAAITPAASTPGGAPSVPHTPDVDIPPEREEHRADPLPEQDISDADAADTNLALQDEIVAQTEVLVQTMLQCGTFITMWARARLPTDRVTMLSRYLAVAECIVAVQHGKPSPLLEGPAEYMTALHTLRLAFFDDHSRLGDLLQATTSIADDVLRTALFLTCKGDQHHATAALLSYGVKPDSRDTDGVPCLTVASRNKLDRAVRLLLQFGANVDMTDRAGRTSWSHICGLQSHDNIATILSAAGANKNLNASDGCNPLYIAAAGGHVDQVQVMLERGMKPSLATPFGWQPLHWAASNCRPQVVKMLVEAGADLNPISDRGRTPLDMVFSKPDAIDIREFLIACGAKTASEMRNETWAIQSDVSDACFSDTADKADLASDSGFESDESEALHQMAGPQDTAMDPASPAFISHTQTQLSSQVFEANADSSNVSRDIAAIDLSSFSWQNVTQHAAITSTRTTPSEESLASPWPISKFMRLSASPTPFFFEQFPQPRNTSVPRTPTLTTLANTELNVWTSPDMANPRW